MPAQTSTAELTREWLAEGRGRRVRFGLRAHIIVRETEDEAWHAADRLIAISPMSKLQMPRPGLPCRSRSAESAWRGCIRGAGRAFGLAAISGPAWASCAVAPVRPSSVAPRTSRGSLKLYIIRAHFRVGLSPEHRSATYVWRCEFWSGQAPVAQPDRAPAF